MGLRVPENVPERRAFLLKHQIVVVNIGRETHFFQFDDLLLLFGFLLLAHHFIAILAVIDDLGHRRLGLRRDEHQVQFLFFGMAHGFRQADDADLLAVASDKTQFFVFDLIIDQ